MWGSGELVERFGADFDAAVRRRGVQYFEGGRVSLLDVGPDAVIARVRGSGGRDYPVRLHVRDSDVEDPADLDDGEGTALEVSCGCPHFERGWRCKHLFACLVELD